MRENGEWKLGRRGRWRRRSEDEEGAEVEEWIETEKEEE